MGNSALPPAPSLREGVTHFSRTCLRLEYSEVRHPLPEGGGRGEGSSKDTTLTTSKILAKNLQGITRLSVDEEGNLLMLQTNKHRLYKCLAYTRYDSTFSMGGNALGREGMNFPSEISVPNRLTTYVLDRNNRRILLLNTNLRIIRDIQFQEIEVHLPGEPPLLINPFAFTATPTGELFVLNQDDNRVYKFDRLGKFELVFGGPDFGDGALLAPTDVEVNEQLQIFVPEPSRNRVAVYDLFGTFHQSLEAPPGLEWERMALEGDFVGFIGSDRLVLRNLKTGADETIRFAGIPKIVDIALRPDAIYVLTPSQVLLFPLQH